jgi:hypothetical protein
LVGAGAWRVSTAWMDHGSVDHELAAMWILIPQVALHLALSSAGFLSPISAPPLSELSLPIPNPSFGFGLGFRFQSRRLVWFRLRLPCQVLLLDLSSGFR